jgi:hypothetical protein
MRKLVMDCSLTGKHDLYSSLKAVNLSGCLDLQEFSKILAWDSSTSKPVLSELSSVMLSPKIFDKTLSVLVEDLSF